MATKHYTTHSWSGAAALLFALIIGSATIAALVTMEALQ